MLHHADPGSTVILGGLFGRPLQTPPNVSLGWLSSRALPGAPLKRSSMASPYTLRR